MKYIVEVRYTGVDWADLMADMRSWLDCRQSKVDEFSHTLLGRGVAVHVGFYSEDHAAAFATSFSGRLRSADPHRVAVQEAMDRPAESDPGPRFPKGSTSLGDLLPERPPSLPPSFTRKGVGSRPFGQGIRVDYQTLIQLNRSRENREKTMRAIILSSILTASAFATNAQEASGDSEAGRVYAREVCSPCHAVTAEQASQRTIAIAPDFQTIANTPGMTATALRAFLQTPHPKMPDLILRPEQSADVIAFLLSLRDRRQPETKP